MKFIAPLVTLLVGIALGYLLFEGDDSVADKKPAPIIIRAEGGSLEVASLAGKESSSEIEISEDWLVSLEELSPVQQSIAFSQALTLMPTERYREFHEMFSDSDAELRWQFINLLQKQWAESAPEDMMAYAETLPLHNDRGLRHQALRVWARNDFEAAWAYVSEMPKGQYRDNLFQQTLTAGAANQPERVLQLLQADPSLVRRNTWVYHSVFQNIAKEDSERARQLVASLPAGQAKTAALQGVLAHLYEGDSVAARTWLDSLPKDSSVYRAKRDMNHSHQLDFEQARVLIEQEMQPAERREMLQQLNYHSMLQNKSFDEIAEVYSWLETNSSGRILRDRAGQFISAMVGVDSDRALAFVMEMPPGDARLNGLASIGNHIAQSDPVAAIRFANSLEFPDERERVLNNVSYQITRDGPEAATAMLKQIGEPYLVERLAGQIIQEWAAYDLEAATNWMYQIKDEEAFSRAQRQLVETWSKDDVDGALNYIATQIDAKEQARYYRNIIDSVSYQNPEQAVSWLEKFPAMEEKDLKRIYSSIANGYTNLNSMEASKWIATLEEGAPRDSAVQSLVNNISRFDPDSALIWAASVDDKNLRENSLRNAVREWMKHDLDAAFDAVKDAAIDAEEKEPLFKMLQEESKKDATSTRRSASVIDPFSTY